MVSTMSTSSGCGTGKREQLDQGVDHLLGVVPGRARVPQRQRGDPVGVDVFGGAFEFGERRDGGARGLGELVVDLEQHRFVGLDDQRAVGHALLYTCPRQESSCSGTSEATSRRWESSPAPCMRSATRCSRSALAECG